MTLKDGSSCGGHVNCQHLPGYEYIRRFRQSIGRIIQLGFNAGSPTSLGDLAPLGSGVPKERYVRPSVYLRRNALQIQFRRAKSCVTRSFPAAQRWDEYDLPPCLSLPIFRSNVEHSRKAETLGRVCLTLGGLYDIQLVLIELASTTPLLSLTFHGTLPSNGS